MLQAKCVSIDVRGKVGVDIDVLVAFS